tara:strand:- start:79 stop:381 length:303 start_codon:yes stop_codon:yes gene_type:complete
MVKDILKGEHFHGNNPDMKLDFAKPSKAEIDEMNYKKPITSFKEAIPASKPSTEESYMGVRPDLGYVNQTPNVNFVDDKKNYAKNDRPALTKDGRLSSGT